MSLPNLKPFVQPFLGKVAFQSQPILDGHIHDGWYIHSDHSEYPDTILQRINTHVFPNPEGLMENIHQVTSYLRAKNPHQQQLRLIKTESGHIYHQAADGSVWRMLVRIPNCYTTPITRNLSQVFEAGKITGLFLKQLQGYPIETINISIPDFHNTPKRYQDFQRALSMADKNLINEIQTEIRFLEARSGQFGLFWNALMNHQIPWRVTHNDTKLDNILFDVNTHQAICLIDLDTIMPGSALFDFGDALRAMGNPASEDEADLNMVQFQVPVFKSYSQGYLEASGAILTELELAWLAKSPWLITIEIGMRFLTDYLQGNHYFRTQYPKQNLNRCRTQFKLASDMENNFPLMESIVKEIIHQMDNRY